MWVLIFILLGTNGGNSVVTQEFTTRERCEAARDQFYVPPEIQKQAVLKIVGVGDGLEHRLHPVRRHEAVQPPGAVSEMVR